MGGAIAKGIISAGVAGDAPIVVSHPSKEFAQWAKESHSDTVLTRDNSIAAQADTIIIAVKPWILESVINEIKHTPGFSNKTLVSIVAGIDIDSITKMAATDNTEQSGTSSEPASSNNLTVFRVIPNTAISLGNSATFICSHNADTECMARIKSLFATMGMSFIVNEKQMGAVTALSSCGIAYILKYIDASIKGGIDMGIEPNQARDIVIQTVKGAIALLEANCTTPQQEIDKVTTPGGLTFKGLDAMNANGFNEAVAAGLKASLSK